MVHNEYLFEQDADKAKILKCHIKLPMGSATNSSFGILAGK
jgi:hypothetical protein